MRALVFSLAICGALASIPAGASAQSAYLEGHVFNKRSGIPLSDVQVRVFENVTLGPLARELASGVTDANGFYQFEIDVFLGFPVSIEVSCTTSRREVLGRSSAVLREGPIRRDIYLEGGSWSVRCARFPRRLP